ncbi:hypothetical protein SAMN06295960_1957 [Paenibacillus aquistagni]|uniref:Uncharacterized protein n=2 Tax=Paenibacillus aquistagni TaxID=1852522 RepID=A0A1X7K166_9BACL|nr:hypothetical protein SAMN06295960_1957 [Paenibacillus aquistagni]
MIISVLILVGVISFIMASSSDAPGSSTEHTSPNWLLVQDEIIETRMSKSVQTRIGDMVKVHFEDAELTDADLSSIVEWINTVPDSQIMEIQQGFNHIKAGILIKLDNKRELLLQYNGQHIIMTRKGFDEQHAMVKYVIEQENLKHFFDQKLESL